ncbi:hypothetical protein [Candidatus Nitrotoga sp. 1052]|nr:hypothetical protein [Candidatus Nitrotoga sp. 1052]
MPTYESWWSVTATYLKLVLVAEVQITIQCMYGLCGIVHSLS